MAQGSRLERNSVYTRQLLDHCGDDIVPHFVGIRVLQKQNVTRVDNGVDCSGDWSGRRLVGTGFRTRQLHARLFDISTFAKLATQRFRGIDTLPTSTTKPGCEDLLCCSSFGIDDNGDSLVSQMDCSLFHGV